MTRGYIGLGSNLGDKRGHLARAITALDGTPGIAVQRVAKSYRTVPMGPVAQEWYLNSVVEIGTSLTPPALLACGQAIEAALGRVRHERWGPRPIDLDLLWLDGEEICGDALILPHPGAHLRSFVLTPWCELAPDLRLRGETLEYWRARADPLGIEEDT